MDHDRLFKALLTTFFAEFIELFLPEVAAGLDRSTIEFIDKEVFADVGSGERHEVDLLAKVRLRGQEAFILVHVENQSSWQTDFPQRMFRYFSLIHGKYALPVYPIAVYSFERPTTPTSSRYGLELFGFDILRFNFRAIQLNTLNWRDFLSRPNPVASALMAKMRIEPGDRPRVKLECLRMMATLKLDPARARTIWVFMDSYLKLTSNESRMYNQEMENLAPAERQSVWTVDDEFKRLSSVDFLLAMLERRLGDVDREMTDRIAELSLTQVMELAEALPSMKSFDDVRAWTVQRSPNAR